MVRKDYYLVLGIPREASERRIQQAFRRLAKEHHPDRVGAESTAGYASGQRIAGYCSSTIFLVCVNLPATSL